MRIQERHCARGAESKMTKNIIYCHLCDQPLRDCGDWDGVWHFICDDTTCPTDEFKIEVITKPAKQKDGTYLTAQRL